jgi:YD repeat-containing protein
MLEITDPVHANTLNPMLERLLNNDSYLRALLDSLTNQLSTFPVLGTDNKAVNLFKALNFSIDTRTAVATHTGGRITKIDEKDGSTIVKSTTITYDGLGRVSKVTETAGGKTVTTTLSYNADGTLSGVSKAVN